MSTIELPGPVEDAGCSEWRFTHSLADVYLSLDADVLLTEPAALSALSGGEESNGGDPHIVQHRSLQQLLGENVGDFPLLRTEDYRKMLKRKKVGWHEVPMVHTAVLVDLRQEESDC